MGELLVEQGAVAAIVDIGETATARILDAEGGSVVSDFPGAGERRWHPATLARPRPSRLSRREPGRSAPEGLTAPIRSSSPSGRNWRMIPDAGSG